MAGLRQCLLLLLFLLCCVLAALLATSLLIFLAYIWWELAGKQCTDSSTAEYPSHMAIHSASSPACKPLKGHNSSNKQQEPVSPLQQLYLQVAQLKATLAAASSPKKEAMEAAFHAEDSTASAAAVDCNVQQLGTAVPSKAKAVDAAASNMKTPQQGSGPAGATTAAVPATNTAKYGAIDCQAATPASAATAATSQKATLVEVSLNDFDYDDTDDEDYVGCAGEQLQGLTLGALIGAGSFGRVYKGARLSVSSFGFVVFPCHRPVLCMCCRISIYLCAVAA